MTSPEAEEHRCPPETTGGHPLGGLGGLGTGAPKGWTTCFAVDSTDGTVARIQATGGALTMPATDTPYGRFAVVSDPWGAPFSVMQVGSDG